MRFAPIVLGGVMVVVGVLAALFPPELLLYHPAGEVEENVTEHVTPARARTYGIMSAAFGLAFLTWAASPTRRKTIAIENYVWVLSQELRRRFGAKNYYTVEQINRAVESAGCSNTSIAYAHAMFCELEEFTAEYPPAQSSFSYAGLRSYVARRYFQGATDFDGATIVRMARELYPDESGFGDAIV